MPGKYNVIGPLFHPLNAVDSVTCNTVAPAKNERNRAAQLSCCDLLGVVSGRPGGGVAPRFLPGSRIDCRRGRGCGMRKALAPPTHTDLKAHVFATSAALKALSGRGLRDCRARQVYRNRAAFSPLSNVFSVTCGAPSTGENQRNRAAQLRCCDPLGGVLRDMRGVVAPRFLPGSRIDCRRGRGCGMRKALAPPAYPDLKAHEFATLASAESLVRQGFARLSCPASIP